MTASEPKFFRNAAAFAKWLTAHHDKASELVVGFHKKDSGKASMTYQEALDEALAIGWIDGVRRRVDDESYSIRFSPRKARSVWSAVNIKRVGELEAAGRMKPEGRAAFARRDANRSGVYSYEREHAELGPDEKKALVADAKARKFFEEQAPYYRRLMTFWVMSAKRPETRASRLAKLIAYSRKGERIPLVAPSSKTPKSK